MPAELGAICRLISQLGLSGKRFGVERQHHKTTAGLRGQTYGVSGGAGVNEVEAELDR